MSGRVRLLTESDRSDALELCERHPYESLFLASRIAHQGIEREDLGCPIWGYEVDGSLVALCHDGVNLSVIGDEESHAPFAEYIGPRDQTASIMGPSASVQGIYRALIDRWGRSWGDPRQIRGNQPLFFIDHDPILPPDLRVRLVNSDEEYPYYRAAVAMYEEEVGPLDCAASYRRYISTLIASGMSFGAYADGQFWFKSEIGCWYRDRAQIEGVWMAPHLRGRRLAPSAFAQVLLLARRRFPKISLYVNSYNRVAYHLYLSVGMRQIATMSTILY